MNREQLDEIMSALAKDFDAWRSFMGSLSANLLKSGDVEMTHRMLNFQLQLFSEKLDQYREKVQ